jgi:hypothetical protein
MRNKEFRVRNAECGMRSVRKGSMKPVLLLLSLFLMGADAGGPDAAERSALMDRQRTLRAKIEVLSREQDLLLFRKMMYSADSKYLMIDTRNRTAQLKYKNRVLKDFRFRASKDFPGNTLRPGRLALTKKVEGKKDRHTLVFGDALVIRWKLSSVPPKAADIPFITLTRKELLSIYHAVEEGALAYVER